MDIGLAVSATNSGSVSIARHALNINQGSTFAGNAVVGFGLISLLRWSMKATKECYTSFALGDLKKVREQTERSVYGV